MSTALNYYGRNIDANSDRMDFMGFTYLGPIFIPPVPQTIGMTDRNGTGQVWYLMWDGSTHLVLTDQPPMPYAQVTQQFGVTHTTGQYTTVYGPWDGPYIGTTGWRLGVTTAQPPDLGINGRQYAGGVPRLQVDNPSIQSGAGYTTNGPPLVAPDINGPQTSSFPEPSNYPAPGVPAVPGIPSSTPPPTGGGFAAFEAAYQTNQPPLCLLGQVAPATIGTWLKVTQPWHLQHLGG